MNQKIAPLDYYCFSSTGQIIYDPKKGKVFEPFWALLKCDDELIDYYKWWLHKAGIGINKGSLWGAHVTFVRGEEPPHKSFWGNYEALEIEYRYSNFLRYDNGRHVWLDVYCPKLNEIRDELGLKPLKPMSLHLTIGRLLIQKENIKCLTNYSPDWMMENIGVQPLLERTHPEFEQAGLKLISDAYLLHKDEAFNEGNIKVLSP